MKIAVAAGLSSCLYEVQYESEPLYDEDSDEDKILIQLDVMMIENFLAGAIAAKANQIDFDAELNFLEDWLVKPKNVDYVCDAECIRFADAEEILLQISTTLHIANCDRAWRTIISEKFAEFVEAQGRFRTTDAQSNSIMISEDFKLSNWKSRKRENINKYYLTAIKVKMKKMEDCRVQRLESQKIKLLICFADL